MITSVLLTLCFLASPSKASVVAPAGFGASAGRMAPILPARSNDGASPIRLQGDALDLRAGMPVLPSPVFGLVGPNSLNFPTQQPDAASLEPSERVRSAASLPAASAKTTAVGARRDLKSGPRASVGAAAAPLKRSEETERSDAQPEQAANGGRRLFDQDRAHSQVTPREPGTRSSRLPAASAEAAGPRHAGVSSRGRSRNSASAAAEALRSPAGETLRDAVASVPSGAVPALIAPAALLAPALKGAPGADIAASGVAAAAGSRMGTGVFAAAARVPLLNVPASGMMESERPMAGAASPAAGVEAALHPSAAMSPTVWLERGSLLEAFSVAEAYAGAGAHAAMRSARTVSANGSRAPASPPSPVPMSAPLWWGWALVPLLFVVIRGNLR